MRPLSSQSAPSEICMRIGIVVKVLAEKKVGFIRSEDLRDDVFFHFSKVDAPASRPLEEGDEVEYEIDELKKIQKCDRLQATLVRRSSRPLSVRLKVSDAPKLRAKHHPNSLKRKPSWRKKSGDEASD
jgi:cold shock CspA family protein